MKTLDKKAFFFDFDGTIWFGRFGEKTLKALRKLHSDGHLLFYNSGRSKGNTRFDKIGEVPFDGFLYGGCHAEFKGEEIYKSDVSKIAMQEVCQVEKEYDLNIVYEGREGVYKKNCPLLKRFYGEELDDTSLLTDVIKYPMSKFSIIKKEQDGCYLPTDEGALKRLEKYFSVVDLDSYYECMQKGKGKDFIIKKVLEKLNIDQKDTYGFGDSLNDMPMFKVCYKNVAIAHSPNALKQKAVFVTTEEENGVFEALCHFGYVQDE